MRCLVTPLLLLSCAIHAAELRIGTLNTESDSYTQPAGVYVLILLAGIDVGDSGCAGRSPKPEAQCPQLYNDGDVTIGGVIQGPIR